MFINTEPRYVLNELGFFVPVQSMDRYRQKILEMPSRDDNAWKSLKPVAYTADLNEFQNDGFENNENFNTGNAYHRTMEMTSQHNAATAFKPDYTRAAQNVQYTSSLQNQVSYSYETPAQYGSNYIRPRQSQGVPRSSEMAINVDCSNYQRLVANESFENQYALGSAMHTPSVPGPLPGTSFPSSSNWPSSSSFGSDGSSSSPIIYDNYSSATSSPSQPVVNLESLNLHCHDGLASAIGWGSTADVQSVGSSVMSDGLSRFPATILPPSHILGSSATVPKWPSEMVGAGTIALKDLKTIPSASSSSLGSSQPAQPAWFDNNEDSIRDLSPPKPTYKSERRSAEGHFQWSNDDSQRRQSQVEQHRHPHRRLLPSSVTSSYRTKSKLSLEDQEYIPGSRIRKSSRKSNQYEHSHTQPTPSRITESVTKPTATVHVELSRASSASDTTQSEGSLEDNHKSSSSSKRPWTSIDSSSSKSSLSKSAHQRWKDDFLVQSKDSGLSYKEIKIKGKFTEAESTLRGRYRTLTKEKSARVRKPEFKPNDDRLLKKAVKKLAPYADRKRIPWKQVGEYIITHGGSYHFGNATCKKRFDELHGYSS